MGVSKKKKQGKRKREGKIRKPEAGENLRRLG